MRLARCRHVGLLAVLLVCARPASATDRSAEARQLLTLLVKRQFGEAASMFEPGKNAVAGSKLRHIWDAVNARTGGFQQEGPVRIDAAGVADVVFVTCRFAKGPLEMKVSFDANGRVVGVFFLPLQPTKEWTPPAYCAATSFHEREVEVRSGERTLPGTLSLPAAPGGHPGVVLVNGSGPNDRDPTKGARKPFADLACGLATRGVAVLRYESRGPQPSSSTGDETIHDATAAARVLGGAGGVDEQRVFVLAHGLGGTLMPRVGRADARWAGLVVLAAPARPLEDGHVAAGVVGDVAAWVKRQPARTIITP